MASEGTVQAEGETPDSSDLPPHASHTTLTISNDDAAATPTIISKMPDMANNTLATSVPLPPAEAGSYEKRPGHTLTSLHKLVTSLPPAEPVAAHHKPSNSKANAQGKQSAHNNQPSTNGSSTSSPTTSESDWASQPSTHPPSQAHSRAGSMSAGTSGGKVTPGISQPDSLPTSPISQRKSGSMQSDGGHKFNLKDLLANGPKLSRRGSQKSASSRKSDSDLDGAAAKSTAGDSTASLSKKYGVCQKVAIGKGATSVVRLAHKWDRTEEKLYAVKEFRKRRKNETEKQYVKKLTAEFCISSTLHHPNIVETVDLVRDENQKWCEVMEFCPGGDLYAAIKKGGMSPSEVECCFKQILNGVGYLHSQGVAHRDIKPENLFFDAKGQLKIGDYGASTVYRLPWEATIHMSTGLCGSEPYIAPEQFLGKPYDARLVDIWACGVVYYCLHFQELPWRAAQPQTDSLYAAYATACTNPSPAVSSCPPTINNLSPRTCRSLVRKMLEPDPTHRVAIEDALAHSWVKGIEICYEVEYPRHIHASAKLLARSQLRDL